MKIKAKVIAANYYSFTFKAKRKLTGAVSTYTFPNQQMKLKVGDKIIMEVKKDE
ncbi:MAG: hypothetical protein GY804_00995 [Alphaproteobacteria bacterium]|nr:hypothetical protein [Alphaproteobacteria bacterium]